MSGVCTFRSGVLWLKIGYGEGASISYFTGGTDELETDGMTEPLL